MRMHFLLGVLLANTAFAQITVANDLVQIPDPTRQGHVASSNPIVGFSNNLCAWAARQLYTVKPDRYDAIVVFTTDPVNGINEVLGYASPRGDPVRVQETGVWYGSPFIAQPPSAYNSPNTLKHCIYMGPMRALPAMPDGYYNYGVTGIEVLGHEFGHHWLVASVFDEMDGTGARADHRMDVNAAGEGPMQSTGRVNTHYSFWADARSVMYGNFITPLGGGEYRFTGGARGYNPLDQYFMGLRAEADVPPMLVIRQGDGRDQGLGALSATQSQTLMGGSAHYISVADFKRVMGPRNPAFPNTQKCWRFAFVLTSTPGNAVTQTQINIVTAYRQRWESWFQTATDGRGRVKTSLDAIDPCVENDDGGVAISDAGTVVDAGVSDAGVSDAGVSDAGAPFDGGAVLQDAGQPELDAGSAEPDAGEMMVEEQADGGGELVGNKMIRDRCNCSGSGFSVALVALLAWQRRRRVG